jgi:hypothetical protein
MIFSCEPLRSAFRLISIWPVWSIALLAPSTPMNELRFSTAGSSRIASGGLLLQPGHAVVGDRLLDLGAGLQLAGVLGREQALGDDHVEQGGQGEGGHGDDQGRLLAFQHPGQARS